MENQIRNARLSFTCDQDWEGMKPDADGRFCSSCQKKVYDFKDKNAAYFIQIMQENDNSICGRFGSEQMARPTKYQSKSWKGWLMAIVALLGLGSCKQEQPGIDVIGKQAIAKSESDRTNWDVAGVVISTGYLTQKDQEKLIKHLNAQLNLSPTFDSHLGLTFMLENGKVRVPTLSGKLDKESKRSFVAAMESGVKLISDSLQSDFPYQINLVIENGRVTSVLTK